MKIEDKEILLKAFNIMMKNYQDGNDFCEGIVKCSECPFNRWDICPNCCNVYEN